MSRGTFSRFAEAAGAVVVSVLIDCRSARHRSRRYRPTDDPFQRRPATEMLGDGFVIALAQTHQAALRLDHRCSGNEPIGIVVSSRIDALPGSRQNTFLRQFVQAYD